MEEEKHEKEEKAAGWLITVLTGWGVPGTLARIIAGAVVGAIAGCRVSYTKLPDGTVQAHGSVVKPVHVTK